MTDNKTDTEKHAEIIGKRKFKTFLNKDDVAYHLSINHCHEKYRNNANLLDICIGAVDDAYNDFQELDEQVKTKFGESSRIR